MAHTIAIMIIQPGEKIHVIFRQLFEGDFNDIL
jgi:hypothetical protein